MASIQTYSEPAQKWECGHCGRLHTEDLIARECCLEVFEVWLCPLCSSKHESLDQALNCAERCADEATTLLVMVNQRELEGAGQLRLLP